MQTKKKRRGNQVKNYINGFKNGDLSVRLSYFIMGSANLMNHQIIKGLLFLAIEAVFVLYMIFNGAAALGGLVTLGVQSQGWVMDENLGIKVQVQGDNSMLFMIYGLATVIIIALFIAAYFVNIKSARNIQMLKASDKKIPSFTEDIHSLLDSRFHISLLGLPTIAVLIFTILPLMYMILLAFTSYDHNHLPPKNLFGWVGFSNFGSMLGGNIAGTFFPLLVWTLIWALLATVTNFLGGVILALLINKKGIRLKKFFRTIFVTTIAVPQFVSLLIMRNMLHASGPLNTLLQNIGLIDQPIPFLTDPLVAKFSVIMVNMWVGIPFTLIVVTSILTNLPEDQVEAARMDGANTFQIFRKITLPQIFFVMTPSLIQQFVGNINSFNVIYLLTGGAPLNSNFYAAGDTDLLVTWLYKLTVEKADYNLASTIGIITFVICAVFSLITYTRSAAYSKEDMYQ